MCGQSSLSSLTNEIIKVSVLHSLSNSPPKFSSRRVDRHKSVIDTYLAQLSSYLTNVTVSSKTSQPIFF